MEWDAMLGPGNSSGDVVCGGMLIGAVNGALRLGWEWPNMSSMMICRVIMSLLMNPGMLYTVAPRCLKHITNEHHTDSTEAAKQACM